MLQSSVAAGTASRLATSSTPFTASPMATDGTITDGPYPETKEVIGGFGVVDVPSREEALGWAAKIAAACRCAQEVRELLPDPRV